MNIPTQIYQIKVTLLRTKPPIWRRLLVPADLTLAKLHGVLQTAMGWEDSHLHEFRIGGRKFGVPDPEARLMGLPAVLNERSARLSTVLPEAGATAEYLYDFGDGWEHRIRVEKVLTAEPGRSYPVCVAGKGHGPPEDCGGISGFYNFVEACLNPDHTNHERMLEWWGGEFDAENFSADEVNLRLGRSSRRPTPRTRN